MRTCYADACSPWPMSFAICWYVRTQTLSPCQCPQFCLIRKSLAWCPLTFLDIIFHMRTSDVSRPWLVSVVVGRCVRDTTNVGQLMHIFYVWCFLTMIDVSYRCIHTTYYARRPWPMSPYIGRLSFPEAHMLYMMCRVHDQCHQVDAYTPHFDVCQPWPMTLDIFKCCFPYA